MADTPRSFSKQDGAFPRYLMENLSTLTSLLHTWSYASSKPQPEGTLVVRREQRNVLQAMVQGGSDGAVCTLVLAPRPGQGSSCKINPGKSLLHGSMLAFGDARRGVLQLVRISELKLCGPDALLRQVTVEVLKYYVPINPWLSWRPDPWAPCSVLHPVSRGQTLWFLSSRAKEEPASVIASSKDEWDTSYWLGHSSHIHAYLDMLHLSFYRQESS